MSPYGDSSHLSLPNPTPQIGADFKCQCTALLTLGSDADDSAISAKFDNGVLTLELLKKQPLPEESKRIAIQ